MSKAVVIVVLAFVVLAGVGGAFILTQNNEVPNNEGQILKVNASDVLLPFSALGANWTEPYNYHYWANLPCYYAPYLEQSPPRPNNVAVVNSHNDAFWTNQSYYTFQDYVVVFNTITEASYYYNDLLPSDYYRNLTAELNSTDEGWYTPDSITPNSTWQYSAFRIKNVIAILSVDSSWVVALPPPLSVGWFKALLDEQISIINSAPTNLYWNSNPPSILMVGYDDLNRTEPNSWHLASYSGITNRVDGGTIFYTEHYSKGGGASETILKLELTEFNSTEAASNEFTYHTGSSDSYHGTLGLGDESSYWSSGTLFQGSTGEVAVRKGIRLFLVTWVFNERGSMSANETQLAINLATLQASRFP